MSAQLILYIHNYTTTSLSRKSQTKTNHSIEVNHNVHKRNIVFNSHLISSIITSFSSITTYFRCTKCYFGLQEHAYKQQLSVGLQANWVTLRDKHTTEHQDRDWVPDLQLSGLRDLGRVEAVPVDGGVLALRVHDVDDDGVRVDVVGRAGVVPRVIRRDRGDLNLGHEISIFFI